MPAQRNLYIDYTKFNCLNGILASFHLCSIFVYSKIDKRLSEATSHLQALVVHRVYISYFYPQFPPQQIGTKIDISPKCVE